MFSWNLAKLDSFFVKRNWVQTHCISTFVRIFCKFQSAKDLTKWCDVIYVGNLMTLQIQPVFDAVEAQKRTAFSFKFPHSSQHNTPWCLILGHDTTRVWMRHKYFVQTKFILMFADCLAVPDQNGWNLRWQMEARPVWEFRWLSQGAWWDSNNFNSWRFAPSELCSMQHACTPTFSRRQKLVFTTTNLWVLYHIIRHLSKRAVLSLQVANYTVFQIYECVTFRIKVPHWKCLETFFFGVFLWLSTSCLKTTLNCSLTPRRNLEARRLSRFPATHPWNNFSTPTQAKQICHQSVKVSSVNIFQGFCDEFSPGHSLPTTLAGQPGACQKHKHTALFLHRRGWTGKEEGSGEPHAAPCHHCGGKPHQHKNHDNTVQTGERFHDRHKVQDARVRSGRGRIRGMTSKNQAKGANPCGAFYSPRFKPYKFGHHQIW